MYFTTGTNAVYAIRSRHDYETSVLPYLLFFFDLPSCRKRGVIRFIRMGPKKSLYLPTLDPDEPPAVLEYNVLYKCLSRREGSPT